MGPFIIALILMIVFGLWLLFYFSGIIIELIINIPILWIVFFRSYVEIVFEKKYKYYAYPSLAALILFILFYKPISILLDGIVLWKLTFLMTLAFIFSQAYMFLYPRIRPYIDDYRKRHDK